MKKWNSDDYEFLLCVLKAVVIIAALFFASVFGFYTFFTYLLT